MARGKKALADAGPVEGLWELPEGWRWARLDDVAPVNPGRDLGGLDDNEEVTFLPMAAVAELSGEIDLGQRRTAGAVRSGFTRFRTGDVIFAKITPCMENGKLAVIPDIPLGVGAGSTEFHVLEPKQASSRYLFYWLSQQTFRDRAERNMQGAAGQRRVPADWLRSAPVPIPPDRASQEEVVERIDRLFAEIGEGEAALAEAWAGGETYRKALLKAAVTGELTADWRRQNPPIETGDDVLRQVVANRPDARVSRPASQIETDGMPELPEHWSWATLEELAAPEHGAISDGPFGSNLKSEHYRDFGPRVVRLQNIDKRGCFVDSKAHIDAAHFASLGRHHVRTGDLVVAILGDPLPRAVIVPPGVEPAMVKADCIKVRLAAGVSKDFVWAWLNSPIVQGFFLNSIKGVGRPRISMPQLRTLPVPLPPANEVEEIVARLEKGLALTASIRLGHSAWTKQSSDLRQSILAAAFRGGLTA